MQHFIDRVKMDSTIQNSLAQIQKQYQSGFLGNLHFENFEENQRSHSFIKIGCFHCQVPLHSSHPSYPTDSLCDSATVKHRHIIHGQYPSPAFNPQRAIRDYAATSLTPVLNVYSSTFCRQHVTLIICVSHNLHLKKQLAPHEIGRKSRHFLQRKTASGNCPPRYRKGQDKSPRIVSLSTRP